MQISDYNASKLATRTIRDLDLMHLVKFTDCTVCDAATSDNIPRRTITIELLVPEPKEVKCTAIIKRPCTAIELHRDSARA